MDYVAYGIYDGQELVASVEVPNDCEILNFVEAEMDILCGLKGHETFTIQLIVRETTGSADVLNSLFGM